MDRCRVHVADGALRVLVAGSEAKTVPLAVARTSQTLRMGVIENESADEEVDVQFPAGMLDSWLRCVADSLGPAGLRALPTGTLVEYLKACDFFADEHRLQACSAALAHRLFANEDQQADHVAVPDQVLPSLHEHLADTVVLSAPADTLERMLSVLPAVRHVHALRAAFPSIAADNSLCLDCEKHSHAKLTAALSATGRLPALGHLDVVHFPLSDSSTSRERSDLLAALCTAFMRPVHVSMSLGSGTLSHEDTALLIGALSLNTALKQLSTVPLPGVEGLTRLKHLTLASRQVLDQDFEVHAGLALLTGLTALQLSGGWEAGWRPDRESILAVLQALHNLHVLEVGTGNCCGSTPSTLLHAAIIQTASRLPKLYDLTLTGSSFCHGLEHLQNFQALRQCSIARVNFIGEGAEAIPTPDILGLARSLRNMPKLEDLSIHCEVMSVSCLLPVFDALQVAGTCHACTALHFYAFEHAEHPTQVCERLKLLTNLQYLRIPDADVLGCSDAGILQALAAAFCGLTHLKLCGTDCGGDSDDSRAVACQVLLPALLNLKSFEIVFCTLPEDTVHVQSATAAIISQNSALECLKMENDPHMVCANALSSATSLTALKFVLSDESDDEVVDWTQVYNAAVKSLGLLTNLQELSLELNGDFSNGFGTLPQSLANLQSLRVVSIEQAGDSGEDNHLEWAGFVKALAKAHTLESLMLQGFDAFSDVAATCIAASLSALTNLRDVKLFPKHSSTTVSFNGANTIAQTLSKLPKLRDVGMRCANLSDEEVKVLVDTLRQCPHLKNAFVDRENDDVDDANEDDIVVDDDGVGVDVGVDDDDEDDDDDDDEVDIDVDVDVDVDGADEDNLDDSDEDDVDDPDGG